MENAIGRDIEHLEHVGIILCQQIQKLPKLIIDHIIPLITNLVLVFKGIELIHWQNVNTPYVHIRCFCDQTIGSAAPYAFKNDAIALFEFLNVHRNAVHKSVYEKNELTVVHQALLLHLDLCECIGRVPPMVDTPFEPYD